MCPLIDQTLRLSDVFTWSSDCNLGNLTTILITGKGQFLFLFLFPITSMIVSCCVWFKKKRIDMHILQNKKFKTYEFLYAIIIKTFHINAIEIQSLSVPIGFSDYVMVP